MLIFGSGCSSPLKGLFFYPCNFLLILHIPCFRSFKQGLEIPRSGSIIFQVCSKKVLSSAYIYMLDASFRDFKGENS